MTSNLKFNNTAGSSKDTIVFALRSVSPDLTLLNFSLAVIEKFNLVIIAMSGFTVRYFEDGSKEHSIPRELITLSAAEGDTGIDQLQTALPVGCFVVVRGRQGVIVPASPPPAGPITGGAKRPRGIAGIG